MTTPSRLLRVLAATLVVAAGALPGATSALANGLGDLYVAVPEGVAEIRLVDERTEATVPAGDANGLAFTNDGAFLFVTDDVGALQRINIENISLDKTYVLPSPAAAIAHSGGDALLIAYEGSARLGVLADGGDDPSKGPELAGKPDLLAADRHDHRVVAARHGESWVDIVEVTSGTVRTSTVDGKVVAMAVADDTGYAYVATTGPNRLLRLALDTGVTDWTAALDGKPAAVTAVDGAAIVAIGRSLVKVVGDKATSWSQPAAGDVTALVTSDEGQFVYAATADAILAVDRARPTAQPRATVKLADAAALAPVHKASSLIRSGGETTDPETGSGSGAENPLPTRAPATDTDDDRGPLWRRSGPDPIMLFGGGAALVVLVLLGSRAVMQRAVGER